MKKTIVKRAKRSKLPELPDNLREARLVQLAEQVEQVAAFVLFRDPSEVHALAAAGAALRRNAIGAIAELRRRGDQARRTGG